jgi:hypothetical protein
MIRLREADCPQTAFLEAGEICIRGWFSCAKTSPQISPNRDYESHWNETGRPSCISSLRIDVSTPAHGAGKQFNTHRLRSG